MLRKAHNDRHLHHDVEQYESRLPFVSQAVHSLPLQQQQAVLVVVYLLHYL